MPLRTEIIRDRAGLAGLAGEWNALLGAARANTIFLTWEWIDAWLTAVHPQAQIICAAVRAEAGKLTGIAPHYRTRMRLLQAVPFRTLRILGDRFSGGEYGDWIVRAADEDEIVAELARGLRAAGGWDCIWLPNCAGWRGTGARFETLAATAGLRLNSRPREFAAVALPASFEAYFQSLSGNARSTLRRRTKAATDAGFTFEACERPEQLPEFLSALFELHGQRWETAGGTSSFQRKPLMRRFYEVFAPVALQKGWLRLSGLRQGGRLRAVQYGYAYGGAFHQLQEGFDPEAPPGIGNVLREAVFRACIEEGLVEYDFLGGFTEHKRRWGAQQRTGCDLLLGRATLRNRLLFHRPVWPTGRFLRETDPTH